MCDVVEEQRHRRRYSACRVPASFSGTKGTGGGLSGEAGDIFYAARLQISHSAADCQEEPIVVDVANAKCVPLTPGPVRQQRAIDMIESARECEHAAQCLTNGTYQVAHFSAAS